MSIQARALSKSYDGGRTPALDQVSVEIGQGEFVAVIGLSGAGKSTFLRSLNGTVPVDSGSLEVLGQALPGIRGRDRVRLRRQIGFIFQHFNLVKNLSALQNVLAGRVAFSPLWRVLTGLYSAEDQARARRALDAVGLSGRYHEKARNLSGGQQQRVAIARALVQEPRIILADEPMASLDPTLSEVVIGMLRDINAGQNITVIVNIHVLALAKKYARRVIAFRQGRIIFDGSPHELSDEKVAEIYRLEAP